MVLKGSSVEELLGAGVSAIRLSGLADWDSNSCKFTSTDNETWFEDYNRTLGNYGRWMCWTLFSGGFENVVKAVCVQAKFTPLHEYVRYVLPKPGVTHKDLVNALTLIRKSPRKTMPTQQMPDCEEKLNYKPLEFFWKHKLPELTSYGLDPGEVNFVCGATRLMTDLIRNRDAHTYQPQQRRKNFYLVGQVFIPCLNKILRVIPPEAKKAVQKQAPERQKMILDLANYIQS